MSPEADEALAPVSLYGRRHWAGLWFGVAALAAVSGVVMVSAGAWAGWFLVVVFGPSAVVLGLGLRPEANSLHLDRNGYTVGGLRSTTRVPWTDVERIGTVDGARHPVVAVRFTPAAAARDPEAAAIAAAMGGYHRTLPLTYGVDPVELADLMDRYRRAG